MSRKARSKAEGPVRSCVGCGARKPKAALVRLALDAEGRVLWDAEQRRPGRGAYLCPSRECLAAALKGKRLARAFRRSVSTAFLEARRCPGEE